MEEQNKQFIKHANAFDVAQQLLYLRWCVIDDVSVSGKFKNAKAQVDFTGNFGHETGGLHSTINRDGLIILISVYLCWFNKM